MDYVSLETLSASQFRDRWQTNWNTTLGDGMPRYLLRGQNGFHLSSIGMPSIISYFSRLPADKALLGQVYTVFRNASQLCTGTWGYHVGHEDALAVFQHYGWRTPSIDFAGTADVALAFALQPAPQTPVIYVLDRTLLPSDVVVSEHDFLIAPAHDGLRSRWWRQDGFGVMNKTWRQADTTGNFNLFAAAPNWIQSIAVFNDGTVPRSTYDALLDLSNDPHAPRIKDVIRAFCDHQFGSNLHPQLQSSINDIC